MDRLRVIDGLALAKDVCERAINEAWRILMAASPMGDVPQIHIDTDNPTQSETGHAVMMLTAYAQHGHRLDAPVQEYCISLIPVAGDALDDSVNPDPSTELGLVVSAAMCREALECGLDVSTARLAALAGLSLEAIQKLVKKGELKAEVKGRGHATEVDAGDAIRWLGARGIKVTTTPPAP